LSVDPANYKDAPTEGIRRIMSEEMHVELPRSEKIPTDRIRSIRMGTTVATNALLERKGDRVALLINEGLRDVLYIGNQSRPKIFDLEIKRPEPIYEEVVEVKERIRPFKAAFEKDSDQKNIIITGINQERYVVIDELDVAQVEKDLIRLHKEQGLDSLAVVLMHSFACP
jgi:5-oxoprolinase (ATP-hydrolysing)